MLTLCRRYDDDNESLDLSQTFFQDHQRSLEQIVCHACFEHMFHFLTTHACCYAMVKSYIQSTQIDSKLIPPSVPSLVPSSGPLSSISVLSNTCDHARMVTRDGFRVCTLCGMTLGRDIDTKNLEFQLFENSDVSKRPRANCFGSPFTSEQWMYTDSNQLSTKIAPTYSQYSKRGRVLSRNAQYLQLQSAHDAHHASQQRIANAMLQLPNVPTNILIATTELWTEMVRLAKRSLKCRHRIKLQMACLYYATRLTKDYWDIVEIVKRFVHVSKNQSFVLTSEITSKDFNEGQLEFYEVFHTHPKYAFLFNETSDVMRQVRSFIEQTMGLPLWVVDECANYYQTIRHRVDGRRTERVIAAGVVYQTLQKIQRNQQKGKYQGYTLPLFLLKRGVTKKYVHKVTNVAILTLNLVIKQFGK